MYRPNQADMFRALTRVFGEPYHQELETRRITQSSEWIKFSRKCLQANGFIERVKIAHAFYEKCLDSEDQAFNLKYANENNFKDAVTSEKERSRGNEQFHEQRYITAIKSYTTSLAYAPVNSLLTAKAYGNRSAALMEAGMFQECIGDINRAFESGYPKQDSYKLLMRKAVCHYWLRELSAMTLVIKEMLEISDKMKREEIIKAIKNRKRPECRLVDAFYPDPPPLAYGANNEIPNVSSAVTLNYNEKYGRHLIANRDIDIGTVLITEKAFCGIPRSEHRYDHCGTCCRLSHSLIPCDCCYTVMFCDLNCKKIANDSFHKTECAVLCKMDKYKKYSTTLHDLIFAIVTRTIATVGLENLQQYLDKIDNEEVPVTNEEKRTHGFTGNIFDSSNFDSVFNLDHRINEKMPADRLFFRCFGSVLLTKCFNIPFDDKNYFKFASLCFRLVSILSFNLHRTGELYSYYNKHAVNDEVHTSDGVYPACKFLIHSCNSNTFYYQYGSTNVVRCMQPIKAGELVSGTAISPLDRSVKLRRELLQGKFEIDCKCELCEKKIALSTYADTQIKNAFDVLNGDTLSIHNLDLEEAFATIRRNKETFYTRIKDLLETRLSYLKKIFKKYPHDSLYFEVRAALVLLYFVQGNLILSVKSRRSRI